MTIYKVQKWIREWGWVTVSIRRSQLEASKIETQLKTEGYRTRIIEESY